MGMTNKQFQGFVRLTLAQIERALKESPDNKELQELKDIFQNMLEDGNWFMVPTGKHGDGYDRGRNVKDIRGIVLEATELYAIGGQGFWGISGDEDTIYRIESHPDLFGNQSYRFRQDQGVDPAIHGRRQV